MEVSYSSMGGDQAFFLPMKMSIHMLCYYLQLSHITCLLYCTFYLSI